MTKINNRVKMLLLVLTLAVIGIISSVFMIDKYVDKCIAKMQPQLTTQVSISVYNNTSDKVEIIHTDKNNIEVYVNDPVIDNNIDSGDKDKVSEEDIPFDVQVTSSIGLNVRVKPNINSDKVDALNYGEIVGVDNRVGDWYKLNNDKGWIHKDYVKRISI